MGLNYSLFIQHSQYSLLMLFVAHQNKFLKWLVTDWLSFLVGLGVTVERVESYRILN